MFEFFLRTFNDKVSITEEEEAFLTQFLTLKKLRKRQYFLQEGEVCKNICFVQKGALRAFVLNKAENENIAAFAFEGWTIGDLYSFFKEEPATLNIDAIEDSELVLISKPDHETLLQQMPKYETYFRILITDAYLALQKRTTNMISLTLEDRYKALIQMYPDLLQRVPQHMVAAFMGLSPETLSRLKSRMNSRN